VPAAVRRYDGMIHGFFGLAGIVDKADEALGETCSWFRRVLATHRGQP
jgi:hypothetical protein